MHSIHWFIVAVFVSYYIGPQSATNTGNIAIYLQKDNSRKKTTGSRMDLKIFDITQGYAWHVAQ